MTDIQPESNAHGYLIVNTLTANGSLPVADAIVTVAEKKPGGEDGDPIYSRVTNADGATPKLELSAPPRLQSEYPAGIKPFTEYRVIVTADGYYAQEAVSVPIFDGITAILPVYLIPLPEYAPGGLTESQSRQEYYNAADGYSSLREVSE